MAHTPQHYPATTQRVGTATVCSEPTCPFPVSGLPVKRMQELSREHLSTKEPAVTTEDELRDAITSTRWRKAHVTEPESALDTGPES